MAPILEIRDIGKKFRLTHVKEPYINLRDQFFGFLKRGQEHKEDFWALKGITFNVDPGESIGIIGRNGAGKSTLLKILSKITPPTEGKIVGRGRIASLLEVGTGFHPELTGLENIYLNGSILGMRKKEIDAKFDAIVDFAETEKFLDTPLKYYSSGMQLRLAFSVAAFLEPEILVIDEVLAVGDAEFQKKCLKKMEDVSKGGRTVLFVSHNMEAVRGLCSRGLIIDHGKLQFAGASDLAIKRYLEHLSQEQRRNFYPASPLEENGFSLIGCGVGIPDGTVISNGDSIQVHFELLNQTRNKFSLYLFVFRNESLAFISSDLHQPACNLIGQSERFEVTFSIPPYLLNSGHCRIGLMIADFNGNTQQFFNQMDLLSFDVEDDGYRRGNRYSLGWSGAVSPILKIEAKRN